MYKESVVDCQRFLSYHLRLQTKGSNKKAALLILYGMSKWVGTKFVLFVMVVERKLLLSPGVQFQSFSPQKAFHYKLRPPVLEHLIEPPQKKSSCICFKEFHIYREAINLYGQGPRHLENLMAAAVAQPFQACVPAPPASFKQASAASLSTRDSGGTEIYILRLYGYIYIYIL